MNTPKPYVLNILSSIAAVESYTPKIEADFMNDHKGQDAILMRLQDIGENLVRIRDQFPDFWEKHATESWHKAIGLRNIISHGYAEISPLVIWNLLNNELALFKTTIEQL